MNQPETSDFDARVAAISAFLRRQYSVTIPASVVEAVAMLGFTAPKRDDSGADWRTVNVDDVLHAFVRAYHAGALSATPAPAPAPRACKRCGESGNVDHDADVAICNLCTDAIQEGRNPHSYNPSERLPRPAAEAAIARTFSLTIEQQFSHLQPNTDGFIDRVITEIAHSNAGMATDVGGDPRSLISAPITAYLGNVYDTMQEFPELRNVRAATLARKLYKAEVKRIKAKRAPKKRATAADVHAVIKACKPCGTSKAAGWTCRGCGALCCEHRCALKRNDGSAACFKCQSGIK